jgi:hypothetical protein
VAFYGFGLHDDGQDPTFGRGAGWTRLWFAIGPSFRLRWRRLFVELHGEVLPGLVLVQLGQAAPAQTSYTASTVGLGGGFRAGIRTGPVTPFVSVLATYWLLRPGSTVNAGDHDPGLLLPDWQLLVAVGASWDLPVRWPSR